MQHTKRRLLSLKSIFCSKQCLWKSDKNFWPTKQNPSQGHFITTNNLMYNYSMGHSWINGIILKALGWEFNKTTACMYCPWHYNDNIKPWYKSYWSRARAVLRIYQHEVLMVHALGLYKKDPKLQVRHSDLEPTMCILMSDIYSQTKWSIPLKITLMNWLFEYCTCWLFQECNSELIIWILNSLVVSKINIELIFLNIKLIIHILGMTSGFNFPIINSLLHSWND